jgi:hypothetical protein
MCGDGHDAVLDPTRKVSYLDAAWEPEWVEMGKNRMKEIVSIPLFRESLC